MVKLVQFVNHTRKGAKIMRSYRFRKMEFKYTIFQKMVLSFTLLLSVSLVFLDLIITNVTKTEVKNQYIDSFKLSIDSDKKYVDFVMDTIDSVSIQILQNKELFKTITTEAKNELEKIEIKRRITKELTQIKISHNMIESIYLVSPTKNSVGYPEISSYKDKLKNLFDNDYYRKAETLGGESLWMPPHINLLSEKSDIVISNVRMITNILTNENAGVLFINIKPETIVTQIENDINNVEKMVIDKDKFILGHTNTELIGKSTFDNPEIKKIFDKINIILEKNEENMQISDSIMYTFQGEKMFGYYSYSIQTNLLYMNVVPYSVLTKTADKLSFIILIISLIILTLTIFSTIIISLSISKPIKTLTNYCDEMSNGNFTIQISNKLIKRHDELGRLAIGFKKINESITCVLSEINKENRDILNISEELNSGNKNLMDRVNSEVASIVEISSTMEELSQNVDNNLDKVNKLNIFIDNTAGKIKTTKIDSGGLRIAISEIKKSSIMIKEMLEVIEEVAFQTNLLALNSTVEAARAGEAGIGFAVVALEIRDLANKTKRSVKDISALINDSEKKNLGSEVFIDKTLENMDKVTEEVLNMTYLISDINKESQEQAEGIKQITQAIGILEEITQDNSNMSEEIMDISNILKDVVTLLSQRMQYFTLDTKMNRK